MFKAIDSKFVALLHGLVVPVMGLKDEDLKLWREEPLKYMEKIASKLRWYFIGLLNYLSFIFYIELESFMTKHPRAHFLDLIHSLERFNKTSHVISLLFQVMATLNECVYSIHIYDANIFNLLKFRNGYLLFQMPVKQRYPKQSSLVPVLLRYGGRIAEHT